MKLNTENFFKTKALIQIGGTVYQCFIYGYESGSKLYDIFITPDAPKEDRKVYKVNGKIVKVNNCGIIGTAYDNLIFGMIEEWYHITMRDF